MAETLPIPSANTKTALSLSPEIRSLLHSRPFRVYLLIIFLWSVSDSAISTLSSVLIESAVSNTFWLGIIFAFSSLVGLICDVLFSKIFANKSEHFFLKWTLVLSVALPLLLIFSPLTVPTLLLAMGIWGAYYELLTFSDFAFVEKTAKKEQFSAAMGLIQTTYAIMFVISAPIIGYLARTSLTSPFIFGIAALLIASLIARRLFTKNRTNTHLNHSKERASFTVSQTAHIWVTLLKRVWPMYLFFLIIYLCNVTNWTIGTLLAYQMQSNSIMGYFLVSTFTLPMVFVTLIPPWLASKFSKKSASFVGGMIAGLFFIIAGFVHTPWLMVLSIFLGTMAVSVVLPLTRAVFEDYVHRLAEYRVIMVGIQASAGSVAYIVGPILIGGLAELTSIEQTYSIIGVLVLLLSLVFAVQVRGKIKMPQTELAKIA